MIFVKFRLNPLIRGFRERFFVRMEQQLLECLRSCQELPRELVPAMYEYGAFMVRTIPDFQNNISFQILKDFPVGSEFGIDYKSWNTGEQFMGLKMIPPGVHFVYVSVKGMPRIGESIVHSFDSSTRC